MPRFTTSTTIDAFSAAIAWRLVPRMRLRMAMDLSWLRLTPVIWFTARSKCWPPGQHIWERTLCSIKPTWMVELPRKWLRGVKFRDFDMPHAGPSGPAFAYGETNLGHGVTRIDTDQTKVNTFR